jgi:AmmeMemoRadiSam system protein B/AmmeMemoRadiSam system protein A
MKKITVTSIGILFILSIFAWPQGIRKSVLAAKGWYDEDPDKLSRHIDYFLQNVKMDSVPTGEILAIIAPHAGHVFSGQVAAFAYRLVQDKDFDSVVILSPSHRYGFEGCSIYLKGGYETPLGIIKVDEPLADEISKATGFAYIANAHQEEHAVEIHLPFIQKVLPQAKIVPIVMGYPRKSTITSLTKGLKKALSGKKALIIASTDLSHFLPKKDAHTTDQKTIAQIKGFEIDTLIKKCERGENIMCGGGPVITSLLYVKNKATVEILKYADSSQVNRDEESVVGYLAAALIANSSQEEFYLTKEEKKELLQLARSTIELFVLENRIPEYNTENTKLIEKKGAFVTLKKNGRLRGCIGFIEPRFPLYQSIMQTAIYATCRDTRFPPVRKDELEELEVEISVLSPLQKISDPKLVKVGKHGLVIAKNGKKGLLLPQVPVENHWNQQTFLEQTCIKAGLQKDAWKTGADIFVFEAVIFH